MICKTGGHKTEDQSAYVNIIEMHITNMNELCQATEDKMQ